MLKIQRLFTLRMLNHTRISSIWNQAGVNGANIHLNWILDHHSGLSILLDSGAGCSIWPKDRFPGAKVDPNRTLQAVNGTRVPTYGECYIKIQTVTTHNHTLSFWHEFILAEISQPLAGWDYLVKFRLDLKWTKRGKCYLQSDHHKIPLKMDAYNKNETNLA